MVQDEETQDDKGVRNIVYFFHWNQIITGE